MKRDKYHIKDIDLDEISLVDVPANDHARTLLIKNRKSPSDYVAVGEKARESSNGSMKKSNEGDNVMDIEELQARLSEVEAEVTKQKERAEAAEESFSDLVKSLEGIDVVVTKSHDGKVEISKNLPEEMIDFNGERIAKSAIPEPLLKHLNEQQAQIEQLRKAKELEDLRKSAEEAFPNLSGTPHQKAMLMKAMNAIEESDREEVMKSLKAADAAVAKLFEEVGSSSHLDEGTAKAKLEKMAKDYASANGVGYEAAFSEVTKSGEGRALFIQSRSE
jgi:hypothetical protein